MGCVDYRYLIKGKVHQKSGKTVHFPGKKGEIVVESTFSAGKCTKKAAKRFTFPEKKGEIVVESTFWQESAPKKRKNGSLPPKRQMRNTVGNNIPGRPGKKEKGMLKKKKGKLNTSHRYNHLPLLPSGPGGVQWELVVYDLPECKGKHFSDIAKIFQSRLLAQITKVIYPDY